MKVKLRKKTILHKKILPKGHIADVDRETGKNLIKNRIAVEVRDSAIKLWKKNQERINK